LALHR